jgi:hypothetical protein
MFNLFSKKTSLGQLKKVQAELDKASETFQKSTHLISSQHAEIVHELIMHLQQAHTCVQRLIDADKNTKKCYVCNSENNLHAEGIGSSICYICKICMEEMG